MHELTHMFVVCCLCCMLCVVCCVWCVLCVACVVCCVLCLCVCLCCMFCVLFVLCVVCCVVLCCGVVWCGVVWCGVVWCGVVSCGVVWCRVCVCVCVYALFHKDIKTAWSNQVQKNDIGIVNVNSSPPGHFQMYSNFTEVCLKGSIYNESAFTRTNADPVQWRIYPALGGDEQSVLILLWNEYVHGCTTGHGAGVSAITISICWEVGLVFRPRHDILILGFRFRTTNKSLLSVWFNLHNISHTCCLNTILSLSRIYFGNNKVYNFFR